MQVKRRRRSGSELRFEPDSAELDRLLKDDEIFQPIKADLS